MSPGTADSEPINRIAGRYAALGPFFQIKGVWPSRPSHGLSGSYPPIHQIYENQQGPRAAFDHHLGVLPVDEDGNEA
jgi:hypothetical protein